MVRVVTDYKHWHLRACRVSSTDHAGECFSAAVNLERCRGDRTVENVKELHAENFPQASCGVLSQVAGERREKKMVTDKPLRERY